MKGNVQAYLELSAAMTIVGSSVVAGKFVTAHFPVFLASAVRFAIATAIFALILLRRGRLMPPIGRKDRLTLLVQAFCGIFVFNVCVLYGLRLTRAASAGIITGTTPAAVAVLSFICLRERPTVLRGVGIGLAIAGVLALNLTGADRHAGPGASPVFGNALILIAVVGEALWTIFRKVTASTVAPLPAAAAASAFALALFLPFAVYEAASFDFGSVSLLDWLPLLYYAVFATVVAFTLWFRGVPKVPASTAGVFTSAIPVSAVVLAYLILKEPLRWPHLVGILLVFAGIVLVTRPGGRQVAALGAHTAYPGAPGNFPGAGCREEENNETTELHRVSD